jgi:hypothetical protein
MNHFTELQVFVHLVISFLTQVAPNLETHVKIVKKNTVYMGDGVVPICIAADARNGLFYIANWDYVGVYDIKTFEYLRWLPTAYTYAIAIGNLETISMLRISYR